MTDWRDLYEQRRSQRRNLACRSLTGSLGFGGSNLTLEFPIMGVSAMNPLASISCKLTDVSLILPLIEIYDILTWTKSSQPIEGNVCVSSDTCWGVLMMVSSLKESGALSHAI